MEVRYSIERTYVQQHCAIPFLRNDMLLEELLVQRLRTRRDRHDFQMNPREVQEQIHAEGLCFEW